MFQFYLNEHFWPAHLGGAFHQFLFVDGHLLLGQGLLCFQRRFLNVGGWTFAAGAGTLVLPEALSECGVGVILVEF
ncbi:hypothetical protein A233_00450 [Pseudomonas syringae pv. actinidiae ICMP 19097]|nr:hypothetical protein A233_00450 [Pseudomonas syringae pv. actinidiae ICMP 19097]